MIKVKINSDTLLKDLLNRSFLTQAQIDTLFIEKLMNNEKLNKKTTLRDNKKVSKSSFIRTLKQAEKNIQRSIYTIILVDYLDLINKDTFEQLLKISKMISGIKNVQSERKLELTRFLLMLIKNLSGEKNINKI